MPSTEITGNIVHTVGARYRARGTGMLRTRLLSMDEVKYTDLDNIELVTPSARERTILANFQDQGIQIEFKTIHMDETFIISKIILFVKPVAESYPILSGG